MGITIFTEAVHENYEMFNFYAVWQYASVRQKLNTQFKYELFGSDHFPPNYVIPFSRLLIFKIPLMAILGQLEGNFH